MTFYTNVLQFGNSLLVREVDEKGQRIKKRVQYLPTLFDLCNKKTGYVTLDGKHVLPHQFDSIKDAKDWYESRKDQGIVYGNTQYAYTYISDMYPKRVQWDKDKLLIATLDIEVECEIGFPYVK